MDNHHNDYILTFVAVNALTNKVQQLESQLKMAENIASNLMDNSANADLYDAPMMMPCCCSSSATFVVQKLNLP